ncbi:hypothetical protein GMDG_04924 [Pseudogymnoascus destructans 20631-21]|uniref:Uncharacterized protein n=1 Tax=Pseudogymnoascus destructans (strain ATCC MYA-4855 / 20631-21) TaxID=658429 RepID=L8GC74_PSED2|nr:hypothetical protein GMDG_04924 [Pseudogymnoascus destructans 20631-21]
MYNHKNRQDTVSSAISRTSRRSDESHSSASTAATSVTRITHSRSPRSSCYSARSSVADFYAEPEEYGIDDDYPTPSHTTSLPPAPSTTAIPTTPHDFASYFPSHSRLTITHDSSALDLGMNLVISTTPEGEQKTPMQLFHLRMHDLPTRAFSLRRYCRESGREVCHSVLRQGGEKVKQNQRQTKHPKLQRSMSTALATVTRRGVKRADSWGASSNKASYPPPHPTPLLTIPTRHDSGYATDSDDDGDFSSSGAEDEEEFPPTPVPSSLPGKKGKKGKTNTTHLEFSNYAHVDLTRRGSAGKGKHWDFEYWGTPYSWKRDGQSYHLVPTSNSSGNNAGAVAHIVPDVLTPSQTLEEAREGGWGGDVADVVVATGVLALVDDKARCEGGRPAGKYRRRIKVPMSPVTLDLEVVTAREMMRSVFRRGNRDERPGTAGGRGERREREGSGLRFGRALEAC